MRGGYCEKRCTFLPSAGRAARFAWRSQTGGSGSGNLEGVLQEASVDNPASRAKPLITVFLSRNVSRVIHQPVYNLR